MSIETPANEIRTDIKEITSSPCQEIFNERRMIAATENRHIFNVVQYIDTLIKVFLFSFFAIIFMLYVGIKYSLSSIRPSEYGRFSPWGKLKLW